MKAIPDADAVRVSCSAAMPDSHPPAELSLSTEQMRDLGYRVICTPFAELYQDLE